MSKETKKQVVEAALTLAENVAGGIVAADDVTGAALESCRALFATVIGPEDPLWSMQVDVARQVLALDGIPGNELAEWVAVVKPGEPGERQPRVYTDDDHQVWVDSADEAGDD